MATLEEILAEVGLGESTQTKTAAPVGSPSTKEVNEVLESLGLDGGIESVEQAGQTKTASEERNQPMGMDKIYESLFQDAPAANAVVAPTETQTKTASETTTEVSATEVEADESTALGELTGIYFNVQHDALIEKLAGDLEMEAGAGHKPQASAPGGGELSKIVGKEGDPAIPMNHDASGGAALQVTTKNTTPYSLKSRAQIKAILKRTMKSEAGDVGGYNE